MCDPYDSLSCPVDASFRLLGRRWAPEVLLQIMGGTVRYSQLQRALPGISPRTLSVRISELEEVGVISKLHRNHVECVYELTEKGTEVKKIIQSIASFSIHWHGVI